MTYVKNENLNVGMFIEPSPIPPCRIVRFSWASHNLINITAITAQGTIHRFTLYPNECSRLIQPFEIALKP